MFALHKVLVSAFLSNEFSPSATRSRSVAVIAILVCISVCQCPAVTTLSILPELGISYRCGGGCCWGWGCCDRTSSGSLIVSLFCLLSAVTGPVVHVPCPVVWSQVPVMDCIAISYGLLQILMSLLSLRSAAYISLISESDLRGSLATSASVHTGVWYWRLELKILAVTDMQGVVGGHVAARLISLERLCLLTQMGPDPAVSKATTIGCG
ncbi:hypothetical protein Tco_1555790 [Tanacetum coccineum]